MTKQKLIVLIIVAVLAVAIPISLIVTMGGNDENNNDPILTPVQEYIQLEGDVLHNLVNSMADTPNTSGTASTSTIDIIPSDTLFAMFGLGEIDMSWAQKLTFTMENKLKGSLIESLTSIGLNGKDIAAINLIANSKTGVNFLMIPTICTQYLRIEQNSITGDMTGGSAASVSGLLSQLNVPEMSTIKTLLNKYIDLALSKMTLVEKTTHNITIAGKTQNVTVYTNYITEKVFNDIIKAVLTELKNDASIKAILPEGAEIGTAIDQILSSLNAEPSESKDEAIVLTTYVNAANQVIGHAFDMSRDVQISSITLSDNNSDAVSEFSIKMEDVKYILSGNKTANRGTYTLSTESGEQTLAIGTLTYQVNGQSGSCELKLSDFIEQTFLGSTEIDPTLKINWNISEDSSTADIDLYLYIASTQIIGIETSSTTLPGDVNITIPNSGIDITDEDRMNYYLSQIQFDTLEQNMREAGVPAAIVDILMAQLNGNAGE